MSTEHETVMAKMARLQGTIEQRKKTLGSSTAALNATSQPRSSSMTFFASSSASPQSSPQANSASSLNLPVVTKTTWQSTTTLNRQPMTNPSNFRPQVRGLTKLILNQPNRAIPIKHPSTSATIPSINLVPAPSSHSSSTLPSSQSLQSLHVPSKIISPKQTPQSVANPLPSSSTSSPSSNTVPSLPLISSLKITSSPLPPIAPSLSDQSIKSDPKPVLPSAHPTNTTNRNELVIGGVSFVRDTQGKKLVRKTATAPSTNLKESLKNEVQKPTPITASVGGMTYIRTKSGNLVELNALQKFQSQKLQELKKARLLSAVNAMKTKYQSNHSYSRWDPNKVYSKPTKVTRPPLIKKNKQCQFFAKTGACRNGLTCVYQHDPLQVAICPRFLRHRCPHSASSCPLSHVPNAHNMEHCSHFPRCNKPDCPYPHVQATTSQICQEFADLGWCSKGAQCTERHVRECPEFSTKGTCSNVGCRLRHIINRNSNDNEDNQAAEPGPSDEDGVGLFFTDLTGTELGGKRKATNHSHASKSHHGPAQGISHNSDRPPKRTKYDAMADNDDYVMFISSDEEEEEDEDEEEEEEEAGETGKSEIDDEPASSVDSEELERVSLERLPDNKSQLSPNPPSDGIPSIHSPIHTRMRSRLASEEIEEGEIFEDDVDGDDQVMSNHGKESITDSLVDDNSSDEDEMIARQLVGGRLRSLAL